MKGKSLVKFKRAAFLGMGLIGSSLARVMKRDGLVDHIIACARSSETRETALKLGIADTVTDEPEVAVSGADLVLLCTPVGAYQDLIKKITAHLSPETIVTDVGSVKQQVISSIRPYLPEHVHFVPGHPIAGTENSGPASGFDTLFEDRWVVLTPEPETQPAPIEKVASLWRQAGARIEIMDAIHHDKVLAITSHVPHLIAYTIVGTANDLEDHLKGEVVKFAASGFRDFTRIAASDPIMWRDIFLNNQEAVLEMLGRLTEDISVLQRCIRDADGEKMEALFTRTREIRRSVIEAGQHIPPSPKDS